MKSHVDKVFYFEEYELMSRVVNLLHFKKSKNDCVFNIDMRRSILVHNNDMRDYDKRSFSNNRRFSKSRRFNGNNSFVRRSFFSGESCFYKCNRLTRS